MFDVVPRIFKNAIIQDLVTYSDINTESIPSEESLRILIHFIFQGDKKRPKIILKDDIEFFINEFIRLGLEQAQYFVEYGNRSKKTARNPDTIHYAAMDIFSHGKQVIVVIADHYRGFQWLTFESFSELKSAQVKVIFLGGERYQTDHNHCPMFSLHHLFISQNDAEYRQVLTHFIGTQDTKLSKLQMKWSNLPFYYNLDMQTTSFYFNNYLDYLLTQPDGLNLHQRMHEHISRNFVSVEQTNVIKLVNKGICFKTIDYIHLACTRIEGLEHQFALITLTNLQKLIPLPLFEELRIAYSWDDKIDYSKTVEMDEITPDLNICDLISFIAKEGQDIATLKKFINMSASLLINLYLIAIAYADNIFFYETLTSALIENFNYYRKLITLDSHQLQVIFPQETFDFIRACAHYNPIAHIKAHLRDFIFHAQKSVKKLTFNIYYNVEKNEYLRELLKETAVLFASTDPARQPIKYIENLNKWLIFIEMLVRHVYCFTDIEQCLIRTMHAQLTQLLKKIDSTRHIELTRDSLIKSEAFALSFVSSHPYVQYFFSNAALAYLNPEYKFLRDSKLGITSSNPRHQNFIKIKYLFADKDFKMSLKLEFIFIERISALIFNALEHELTIARDYLNMISTQFQNIKFLLNYLFNKFIISLTKSQIQDIILGNQGKSLKYVVANYALIRQEIPLIEMDKKIELFYTKKFTLSANFWKQVPLEKLEKIDIDAEHKILLCETGKKRVSSPITVSDLVFTADYETGGLVLESASPSLRHIL